ncbi:hypothetical protein AAFF_G00183150 [Aldrovandia affinis]|uniref:Uncharacterized protein n=1 Tax=Aldrovandia affinis TaxID=143900 RepID=A0AAD7RKI1_9TELE|nr:hypothetical protein AAFF_G00183150 [Aldrovandia affinis]
MRRSELSAARGEPEREPEQMELIAEGARAWSGVRRSHSASQGSLAQRPLSLSLGARAITATVSKHCECGGIFGHSDAHVLCVPRARSHNLSSISTPLSWAACARSGTMRSRRLSVAALTSTTERGDEKQATTVQRARDHRVCSVVTSYAGPCKHGTHTAQGQFPFVRGASPPKVVERIWAMFGRVGSGSLCVH